jgi:hypothetical protein
MRRGANPAATMPRRGFSARGGNPKERLYGPSLAHLGPVRGDWSVTASWDTETTLDKAEYSKWVISRLQPEVKVAKGDESQLTFPNTRTAISTQLNAALVW